MPTYRITEYYSYSCEHTIEADCEDEAMLIIDSHPLVHGKDSYEYENRTIEEIEN